MIVRKVTRTGAENKYIIKSKIGRYARTQLHFMKTVVFAFCPCLKIYEMVSWMQKASKLKLS
jgi:hypothetical protein